jgi:hypothetical protein
MKLHASLKGVFIAHCDHDKLYNYVTYNIEERYRKLFYDLLKLVRYFTDYEGGKPRDEAVVLTYIALLLALYVA